MSHHQEVSLLCVPFGLGAGRKGVRLGPDAILQAGLERRLKQLGIPYDLRLPFAAVPPPPSAGAGTPSGNLHYLDEVVQLNEQLAAHVAAAADQGRMPLVLGGDHSIAIGTVAGLAARDPDLGVLWFDAHSDLNTEHTSPSGNIHGMSLAAALGLGHGRLTGVGGYAPKLRPEQIIIIGARQLDPGERSLIRAQGITCYTMHDIDRLGIVRIMEQALAQLGGGRGNLHVSFDIDSVDPLEAPGTGTPVKGGLSYREAHFALELLHEIGRVRSAEFVEVNPTLDTDNKTARLAVELICSLLGQRIL